MGRLREFALGERRAELGAWSEMRKIAGKAHRLWLNVEPYLGPLGWFQGIIGTAVLAALTAFWSWVVSTIQAVNSLGWGVWLVLGLVLAVLSLVGAALTLAITNMRLMRQRARDASGTDIASEPATVPEHRPRAANEMLIKSPSLAETPEDRAAKHDLAIFIAEHVIPTYEVQVDLQGTIVSAVCGRNKVIRELAWTAHKDSENMRQYAEHIKILQSAIREGIATVNLEHMVTLLEAVAKLHHALCSYPKWLAGSDFDYKSDDTIRPLYEDWRARQEALVDAFRPFTRDIRFPRFYDLSDWRRLGEGFETDA